MPYKYIEFQKVSYVYNFRTSNQVQALKNVALEIYRGEFVSVVGASGSGKSTLAKHCNGILIPTEGRVMVNGKDTRERKKRARLWQEVGLVLQNPEQQLFEATVFDDVAFGPKNLRMSGKEIEKAVARALDWVGLDVKKVGRLPPFALSGGERRRVAIAGVLAFSPSVLVLDEPLAGLDPSGRKMLLEQLSALHRKQGITVILITHNMDDAAAVSDRVIVMEHGSIKMQGKPEKVFSPSRELEEIGLEVPFATKVIHRLQRLGYPVREACTLEGAVAEILRIYRDRRSGRHA